MLRILTHPEDCHLPYTAKSHTTNSRIKNNNIIWEKALLVPSFKRKTLLVVKIFLEVSFLPHTFNYRYSHYRFFFIPKHHSQMHKGSSSAGGNLQAR